MSEEKILTEEELNNIAGGISLAEEEYNWFLQHEEYLIEANKILKSSGKIPASNYLDSIITSHNLPKEWKFPKSFYTLIEYKAQKGV